MYWALGWWNGGLKSTDAVWSSPVLLEKPCSNDSVPCFFKSRMSLAGRYIIILYVKERAMATS